jgi:predicted nucleotidyltransferase
MDQLMASLLDLLHELEGQEIPIVVGGGFGLFLKRQHLNHTGQQMLFDRLPEPRSTNDLDLFLRVEVLADLGRTRLVEESIRRLGYTVIENAKFYQWKREVQVGSVAPPQEVKIDVLVGPFGEYRKKLHVESGKMMRRVRPKGKIKFHAHAVEEAIHIEDDPIAVTISGKRSAGEPREGTVYVPQAFPYLMMKLHAFEDRQNDEKKDLGQHHALDLYTIVAMMTESEYERAKELGVAQASNECVRRACEIVRNSFGGTTAIGVLRLREHKLFHNDFLLDEFMSVLGEIFSGE